MSYDASPEHSTMAQAKTNINYFLDQEVTRSQLVLGVPFYGRHLENWGDAKTYNYIVNTYSPDSTVDVVDSIYFNGISTIKEKTQYAIDNAFAGIMIWELGQDAAGDMSLAKAIYDTKVKNQ